MLEIPRLRVQFQPAFQLDETSMVLSVGSCFSERAAAYLSAAGIPCASNPSGTVYHPFSIRDSLRHALLDIPYSEEDFFFFDGFFRGYEHHGSFSRKTLPEALAAAEEARLRFRSAARQAGVILLTPGTAVVFEHRETHRLVANCHKLPPSVFERRLLSMEECVSALSGCAEICRNFSEKLLIVFTVSPVRHNPGDVLLEARSKARLLLAEEKVLSVLPQGCADYFPAREILTEELRDYRFYKEDLLHPSELAERMIVQQFFQSYFGAERGEKLFSAALKQLSAAAHRPIRNGA